MAANFFQAQSQYSDSESISSDGFSENQADDMLNGSRLIIGFGIGQKVVARF